MREAEHFYWGNKIMDVSRETAGAEEWAARALQTAQQGAARLGFGLAEPLLAHFKAHLTQVAAWNESCGLTGRLTAEQVGEKLLLDSLLPALLWPKLRPPALVDVGSGNGFPAIPLALAWGAAQGELYEVRAKKAWFLHRALRAAGLQALRVVRKQWRGTEPPPARALVTSKAALAPDALFGVAGRARCSALAYLGPSASVEQLHDLARAGELRLALATLRLPFCGAQRQYALATPQEAPKPETDWEPEA